LRLIFLRIFTFRTLPDHCFARSPIEFHAITYAEYQSEFIRNPNKIGISARRQSIINWHAA